MEYYIAKRYEGKLPPHAARFMRFDYYKGVFEDPFFGRIENGIFKGYLPEKVSRGEFEERAGIRGIDFSALGDWIVYIDDEKGTVVSEKFFGRTRGKVRFSVRCDCDSLPPEFVNALVGMEVPFPAEEVEVSDDFVTVKGVMSFVAVEKAHLDDALRAYNMVQGLCSGAYVGVKGKILTAHCRGVKLKIGIDELNEFVEFMSSVRKECPSAVFHGVPTVDVEPDKNALLMEDGSILAYTKDWRTPCGVYKRLKSSLKNMKSVTLLDEEVMIIDGDGYTVSGDLFFVDGTVPGALDDVAALSSFSGPATETARRFIDGLEL